MLDQSGNSHSVFKMLVMPLWLSDCNRPFLPDTIAYEGGGRRQKPNESFGNLVI
jgi:hypothetical protein